MVCTSAIFLRTRYARLFFSLALSCFRCKMLQLMTRKCMAHVRVCVCAHIICTISGCMDFISVKLFHCVETKGINKCAGTRVGARIILQLIWMLHQFYGVQWLVAYIHIHVLYVMCVFMVIFLLFNSFFLPFNAFCFWFCYLFILRSPGYNVSFTFFFALPLPCILSACISCSWDWKYRTYVFLSVCIHDSCSWSLNTIFW